MTVGTMDGKKTLIAERPHVIIVRQPETKTGKSRVARKHVIIGVTCAVVVAMVITGVLVGVKIHLDRSNQLDTVSLVGGEMKQDVGVDVKNNYILYHAKNVLYDDNEVWLIHDFNLELQVLKVKLAAETQCYIATLNVSVSARPPDVLHRTSPAITVDGILSAVRELYVVSKSAIEDHIILGAHGRKLCRNVDVHWMTKTCAAHKHQDPAIRKHLSRQKRQFGGTREGGGTKNDGLHDAVVANEHSRVKRQEGGCRGGGCLEVAMNKHSRQKRQKPPGGFKGPPAGFKVAMNKHSRQKRQKPPGGFKGPPAGFKAMTDKDSRVKRGAHVACQGLHCVPDLHRQMAWQLH